MRFAIANDWKVLVSTSGSAVTPARLRPGDTVAAVTLSWGGPGTFPERYAAGKAAIRDKSSGCRVVEMRHALRDPVWIAANPKARADDLMEAFADESIRAVISTIGGDDSIRILPHVDSERAPQAPQDLHGVIRIRR